MGQHQTNTRSSVHCDNAPNNNPTHKACECDLHRRDKLICAILPLGVADAGQSWMMITGKTHTSELGEQDKLFYSPNSLASGLRARFEKC